MSSRSRQSGTPASAAAARAALDHQADRVTIAVPPMLHDLSDPDHHRHRARHGSTLSQPE